MIGDKLIITDFHRKAAVLSHLCTKAVDKALKCQAVARQKGDILDY